MDTTLSALHIIGPALAGAAIGAVAALVMPNGDQGDVMAATPAVS
jgi:hypothetical protein